jgi:hypothetical protein
VGRTFEGVAMFFIGQAKSLFDEGEKGIAELDVGWAKAALYFRTGQHFGHADESIRARSLAKIHELLCVYKSRYESGNTLSLLSAVALCAAENLPLPTWLAILFQSTLTELTSPGGAASLDAVFSSPNLPTDTPSKAATARQDWALGGALYWATWEVARGDTTIQSLDAALTKALEVGNFGVKKTKARVLFLMIEKNQLELLSEPKQKTFSRFLEVRRKL